MSFLKRSALKEKSAAPPQGNQESDFDRLVGRLLEIRAEAQHLLEGLEEVERERASGGKGKCEGRALPFANARFSKNQARLTELFAMVHREFEENPALYRWCADEVAKIENAWEETARHWLRFEHPQEDRGCVIEYLTKHLRRMIYGCAALTIPSRVREHLEGMRSGHAFQFHTYFEDELESQQDRVKILRNIADHAKTIPGLVDVKSGWIYRASRKTWRRIASIFLVILAAALGFVLLPLILNWVKALNIFGAAGTIADKEILTAYFFLLLGAGAHFAVGAVKQSREDSQSGLRALDDWVLWIHIREWSLVQTVVYLWGALLFLLVSFDNVDWSTAFFAGYSIDSLVDVFLARFTTWAEAGSTALKAELKEAPAAG